MFYSVGYNPGTPGYLPTFYDDFNFQHNITFMTEDFFSPMPNGGMTMRVWKKILFFLNSPLTFFFSFLCLFQLNVTFDPDFDNPLFDLFNPFLEGSVRHSPGHFLFQMLLFCPVHHFLHDKPELFPHHFQHARLYRI